MKKIAITLKYDDADGYKGHGEVVEALEAILQREIEIELEGDNVIKSGWKLKIKEVKPKFKTYEYGSEIVWVGSKFFVVEDTGKYNILIANTLDKNDPEYNDWWVDKDCIEQVNLIKKR